MKAFVDQESCIGCGLCATICPEVFRMNDEGVAEVCGEITSDNEKDAVEAMDSCPVAAITIED
jgi:ferredoxin